MATAYNLPGGATPGERGSYYLDDKNAYSTNAVLPSGNLMTNGGRIVKVTHLRAWIAGRGSARSVQIGLDGSWTGYFTMGAAGSANDTGWIPYGGLHSPGSHIFYINPAGSGGIYFGRGKNGTGSTALVGGSGGWSGSLSGQMLVISSPTVTRNVTAVRNANGTITVSWTAPASDGGEAISTYYIGRATNSSFTQNASQTNVSGSTRSYTFSGLTPGATYYFRVSSGNSLNTAYGYGAAWSNVASAQSSAVPAAPGSPVVTKSSPSSTTFNFSWTAPSDNGAAISNYELQWSGTSDFASIVGSDISPGTTKSIPSFALATRYHFRVRAINSIGEGPWSSITSFPNVPSAPSSVGVAPVNSTTLTASWNAPTNAGGDPINDYELQWSTSPTFSPGSSSNGNNTSRNVGSLTALTLYYFRVRAINGIGTSVWSAVSSFTTADTEPPPPPPAVTRGGRLKVGGTFIEPIVRIRDDDEWKEPISKTRQTGVWLDPV